MLEGFEMPKWTREDSVSTDRYGKFVVEPFERGYGVTIGNSLRRVLLGALEGAAITSVRVEGVQHEFSTIPGVTEDVTQIVLNLKRVNLRTESREPITVEFEVEGEYSLTAGELLDVEGLEVLNPEQHIMTLNSGASVSMELEIGWGRGYRPAVDNKQAKQPLGTIPIDSIFSPVTKVNYVVEDARVGQRTDYDSLVLEVWTNGAILPEESISQAARILMEHLSIFASEQTEAEEPQSLPGIDPETQELLDRSVDDLDLSVRSANCLRGASIRTIGELIQKSEAEMLQFRNFGKKSLDEIKDVLHSLGMSLGMTIDPATGLLRAPVEVGIQAIEPMIVEPPMEAEEDEDDSGSMAPLDLE